MKSVYLATDYLKALHSSKNGQRETRYSKPDLTSLPPNHISWCMCKRDRVGRGSSWSGPRETHLCKICSPFPFNSYLPGSPALTPSTSGVPTILPFSQYPHPFPWKQSISAHFSSSASLSFPSLPCWVSIAFLLLQVIIAPQQIVALSLCLLASQGWALSLGTGEAGGKTQGEVATLGGGWASPGLPKIKRVSSPPGLISFRMSPS